MISHVTLHAADKHTILGTPSAGYSACARSDAAGRTQLPHEGGDRSVIQQEL